MFPPWPAFVAQADAFSLIEFADVKAARPDASAELFIGGATGLGRTVDCVTGPDIRQSRAIKLGTIDFLLSTRNMIEKPKIS
jgi:hypothetical protein